MTDEPLYRAVVAAPDDDAPRLVLADWYEENGQPERAEFIRVQVELARRTTLGDDFEEPESPKGSKKTDHQALEQTPTATLGRRERALLKEHQADWVADLPKWATKKCEFRRGFYAFVETTGRQWMIAGTRLREAHPIEGVSIRGFADGLLASEAMKGIRELVAYTNDLGDAQAEEIARAPALYALRRLHLSYNDIGTRGVGYLAGSWLLKNLRELRLSYNRFGDAGVQALADSEQLRELETLTLTDDLITADGVRALCESPVAQTLRVLHLDKNEIGPDGAEALAQSPNLGKLRTLLLTRNQIGDAGVKVLAQSPHLAGLRELHVGDNGLSRLGASALVASPTLTRLTKLNLRYSNLDGGSLLKLKARFGKALVM
jgi:uncharacterized protein (TIGR02996 family)